MGHREFGPEQKGQSAIITGLFIIDAQRLHLVQVGSLRL